MSAASTSFATPADSLPQAAASLREAIERVLGRCAFVDMSFPRATMLGNQLADAGQILRRPENDAEQEFLLRFRQSGGNAPIPCIDIANPGFEWPPRLAALDEGNTIVIGFAGPADAAAAADRFCHPGTALLVPLPNADRPAEQAARRGLRGYRSTRVATFDGRGVFNLYVPRDAASPATGRSETVTYLAPEGSFVLDARTMLHDGGYVSEGDSKYSWLWTGPAPHFHLVVPMVGGQRARQVEICVPRTEDPANLELLAVQCDGRPVEHRLDRWSDTSGKIIVQPGEGTHYTVLTLIVPSLSRDANSGRLLGLCVDKMILTP